MPIINLVTEGKTLEVTEGTNLRKALLKHGISPYVGKDKILNCLGFGLCGTCRVEIVDGKGVPAMTDREEAALIGLAPFYGRKIPQNVRLACRINLTSDVTLKTHPKITIDWALTKERLAMTAIWAFFGLVFFASVGLLMLDMAKLM